MYLILPAAIGPWVYSASNRNEYEFFSMYLILPAAIGPWVYSASNRNEYQEQKTNISGE
jgi:hypothetical protein